VLALLVWDTQVGFHHWEHWELVLAFVLLVVGIVGSAGLLVYGIIRARRSAGEAEREQPHVERPEPELGPAAGRPAADV
jgi:heme/copper-type cytochrome/quinol oxidase subunit 2